MQYYKRSEHMQYVARNHSVKHRHDRTIPGIVPAHDVWVFKENAERDPDRLYLTIKNPSKPYRPAYLA